MKAWFLTIMFLMPGAEPDEVTILTLQAPSQAMCIHFSHSWKVMSTHKMIRGENIQEVVEVVSTHCKENDVKTMQEWKPGRESATTHVEPPEKAENLAELLELIERREMNPHHTWRKRAE